MDKYKNDKLLKKISEHFMDMDIHNSTALEGNSLTRAEVSVFLENGITVHGKSFKDFVEVNNYNETLKWLKKNIHNKELRLSIMLCKKIHNMITQGTLYKKDSDTNYSGKFRDDYVFLSTTTYIPPDWENIESLLEVEIDNYYDRLECGYDVFESACIFHRAFERIHPFFDGNGRTGRILLNMLLIQDGYPYLTISLEQRADYFDALENNKFYNFAKEVMKDNYEHFLEKEKDISLDNISTKNTAKQNYFDIER